VFHTVQGVNGFGENFVGGFPVAGSDSSDSTGIVTDIIRVE
jgi:hypothetical protein